MALNAKLQIIKAAMLKHYKDPVVANHVFYGALKNGTIVPETVGKGKDTAGSGKSTPAHHQPAHHPRHSTAPSRHGVNHKTNTKKSAHHQVNPEPRRVATRSR
jgi:hypothetical protein